MDVYDYLYVIVATLAVVAVFFVPMWNMLADFDDEENEKSHKEKVKERVNHRSMYLDKF